MVHSISCPASSRAASYASADLASDANPDSLFTVARRQGEARQLAGGVYLSDAQHIPAGHDHGRYEGRLLSEGQLAIDRAQLPSSISEMLAIPRLRVLAALTVAAGLC